MRAEMVTEMQSRLVIHRAHSASKQNNFAEDVRAGLTRQPKTLPPKYFYDALGSQLFEAICLLPEYYPTRAETEIFENYATSIIALSPAPISIVELGSGSSVKTRLLIEAALRNQKSLHYQPIDISASILEHSARKLLDSYPQLSITGRVLDYTRGLGLGPGLGPGPSPSKIERGADEKLLVLFLGSNIGNYNPDEAEQLLREIRLSLQPGDGLLLGADLKKPAEILEAAYDDALGVTAAFNLNLLSRINRELDADFDLAKFKHRAIYNKLPGRVEMHLVSLADQTVEIKAIDARIEFKSGESIHTESSYKYQLDQLESLAEMTGFKSAKVWLDEGERFSCSFWKAEEAIS